MSSSSELIFTEAQGVALHLGEERGVPGRWEGLFSCSTTTPIPADLPGCDPCWPPGNAAVVLRSRLKVRVVKELRGKKVAVPNGISENGVLAAALDAEVGKQVMQYQVCGPVPHRAQGLALGQGVQGGGFGLDTPQPCPQDLPGSPGAARCCPAPSACGGLTPRS